MRILIIVFLILSGCSHKFYKVDDLAKVSKQNKILAYESYAYEDIFVTGKIINIDVDTNMQKAITRVFNDDNRIYVFKASDNADLQAFFVVADQEDYQDIVICFFDYPDASPASKYKKLDTVTVFGTVYRFITIKDSEIIILNKCQVK